MIRFKYFVLKEEPQDIQSSHDFTIMRANPFTAAHQGLVGHVASSAADCGGSHSVLLTRTQDKKKNPLTPEQKLYWAKKSFPDANIQLMTPEEPTLLHYLSRLHREGVTDPHLHVGSDRAGEFEKLVNTYNGVAGRHGFYNFPNITVHPYGDTRDDEDTGMAGISASAMRNAAMNADRDSYHAMSPSTLSPEDKDEQMRQVYNGMNPPPPEPKVKAKKKV